MKIISGLIYHESNTFNPLPTGAEQFVVLRGQESLERVASTKVFEDQGIEVVPSIYAMALSSGVVERDVYEGYKNELLKVIADNPDLDAIWLHLHGAMIVAEIGCAEVDLLQAIRDRVGKTIPIALALDPHGNITKELTELATIIRAYRTIPHIDQREVEARTAEELVRILQKKPGEIGYSQIPIALSGEMALSDRHPLNGIIQQLDQFEQIPGILDASFFVGFAWADVSWNSASVLIVPESDEFSHLAQELADQLANTVLETANQFEFQMPVLSIDKTLEYLRQETKKPLFISDSGDNTTGGAVGANTVLLRALMQEEFDGRILITTMFDPCAAKALSGAEVGDTVQVSIGMNLTPDSAPVEIQGILKAKGNLLGYMSSESDVVGQTYTVQHRELDVVVTNISGSFVSPDHFAAAGLHIDDYDVIVLKQGYLFPKLASVAGDYFMSLTPGGTYQLLQELEYKNTEIPSKNLWQRKPENV